MGTWVAVKTTERDEAIRLRRQGLLLQDIGKRLGRHPTTVFRLTRHNCEKVGRFIDQMEVLKLRLMNVSTRDIALELGFDMRTIQRNIKKATLDQWDEARQRLYAEIQSAAADGDTYENIKAWSRLDRHEILAAMRGASPRRRGP